MAPKKNKKHKKDIKVRDLKPRKDAKGGFGASNPADRPQIPPGPNV